MPNTGAAMTVVRVLTFPLSWKTSTAPIVSRSRPMPSSWAYYAHTEDVAALKKINPHFSSFPPEPAPVDWKARAKLLATKAATKAQSEWDELETAPEGSIKKRVHRTFEKLLEKIDPMENFFKHVTPSLRVNVEYPDCIDQLVMENELLQAVRPVTFCICCIRVLRAN